MRVAYTHLKFNCSLDSEIYVPEPNTDNQRELDGAVNVPAKYNNRIATSTEKSNPRQTAQKSKDATMETHVREQIKELNQ